MSLGYLVCMAKSLYAKGVIALTGQFMLAHVNVEELLSNEGAAGEGGALYEVNQQVKEYGGGSYTIAQNAVIYIVGVAFLVGCALMAVHAHNAQKRDEDKAAMGWKFVSAVLGFGGIAIMLFAQKIGEALFR